MRYKYKMTLGYCGVRNMYKNQKSKIKDQNEKQKRKSEKQKRKSEKQKCDKGIKKMEREQKLLAKIIGGKPGKQRKQCGRWE